MSSIEPIILGIGIFSVFGMLTWSFIHRLEFDLWLKWKITGKYPKIICRDALGVTDGVEG